VSREHLDRHLASEHLKRFIALAADLLAEPPRIETYLRIA
jgi:quinol monooxygenase YgiN